MSKEALYSNTMNPTQWRELLTEISRVLLLRDEWSDANDVSRPRFSNEARASGFIGYDGATEEQIVAAEARLGVRFPPSYRAFLSVSNGWPEMWGSIEPGQLWGTEHIQWARDQDPNLIEVFSDNGGYEISPEEHLQERADGFSNYRAQYVAGLLSISEHGDACEVLLCPEVDENGEWECWKMGGWCGIGRFAALEDWFVSVLEFHGDFALED